MGDAIDATVFGLPAGGLTLVASGSTSATSTLTLDNVFTAAYRNYKLFIDGVSSANDIDIVLKLRTGGVTNSNANYAQNQISSAASYGITRSSGSGNTVFHSTLASGTIKIVHESIFFAPQVAIATGYQAMSTSLSATFYQYLYGGSFANTTQFDGFIFTPSSGTITLNYRLYGMAD